MKPEELSVENPTFETNEDFLEVQVFDKEQNNQKGIAEADKVSVVYRNCGWLCFEPAFLQRFRTAKWVLFWLCWAAAMQGGRAKVLQKAKVNVIENDRCRRWYKSQGKKTKIQETQICAGYEQGGVDSCWADSGGPLMVAAASGAEDKMIVVGVVSTGIGCARPYLPGLYTRVSDYIPWIRSVIESL